MSLLNKAKSLLSTNPHVIAMVTLLILVLTVYLNTIGHEYILNWDDGAYVAENNDIRGITVKNLTKIFTTCYMGNYAPLHMFSYMLEGTLWGLQPNTLLMTNMALHAGSTLLFYCLLIRYGFTSALAFTAAALFAVHPVQVESVAWISQRKNVLAMLLLLVAWHSWLSWKLSTKQNHMWWYAASLGLFTLALLAKSVAVILPLIFMFHELSFASKPVKRTSWLALLPYLLLAGLCFVAAYYSQEPGSGRMAYFEGSMAKTMMNMLPVFSRYLTLLAVPLGLSIVYNAPIQSTPDMTIILSGVVFLLFMFGWLRLWHAHRTHFFWLSLFVIGLLPVSNIIPIVTMMNDRYLYFPMLGIAPFAVLSCDAVFTRFRPRFSILAPLITLVIILILVLVSRERVSMWKDSLALWRDTVAKSGDNSWYGYEADFINKMYADALAVKARELSGQGNNIDARHYYHLALTYDPSHYYSLLELSTLYLQRKQPLAAQPYLLRLTNLYKKSADGHFLLAAAYANSGKRNAALEELHTALTLNPQHEQAGNALRKLETLGANGGNSRH